MTAKKKLPKKPRIVKDRQLPLILNAKAQTQLAIAHAITGEKTATKAIIQCMYNADHFMKEYQKEKERADNLEHDVARLKQAISNYIFATHHLGEVAKSENNSKTIKRCGYCDEPLIKGKCPDCD